MQDIKKSLKELFSNTLLEMSKDGNDLYELTNVKMLYTCYIRMYKTVPYIISTSYEKNGQLLIESDCREDEYYFEFGSDLDGVKTFEKLYAKFKDVAYVAKYFDDHVIIADKMFITCYDDGITMISELDAFPEEIEECFVKNTEDDTRYMSYVTMGSQGFKTSLMKVNKRECDVVSNYNDDLPIEKINNFIAGEESGIAILYGMAGTGKTSLLRHLIYTSKKDFLFLDSGCFNYITDASFVKLLIDNRDSVIVLEDCEDLLRDRIQGNARMSALLNLSDGILGDSLNLKFICTFNADLKNIDPAILRKGRLKIKYEIKALTPEKTQALAKKLGKEIPEGKSLPLCEIFNYGEDNGAKPTTTKKPIGFN